jgi:hypothetical protein
MPKRSTPPPHPLDADPLLIGMVHLPPLPGAPGSKPSPGRRRPRWRTRAVADAKALSAAGFSGVLVENYGDAPYYKERVPAETIAAMTLAAHAVREALPPRMAVGVNVLRNDGRAAIAIAAAAGLDFVRINVLTGAVVADQGLIEGRAAELLRERARLAPRVRILADLRVKHAEPLAMRALSEEARDATGRAGADAVIVSGPETGTPVDEDALEALREAVPEAVILVGSGADVDSIGYLLESADGVIVGTAIKRGGRTTAPVDPKRARAFVAAARKG